MTLRAIRKNHSRVKLLRGYGASISLKANRVCLKDGVDPFTGEAEKEEWFVSQIPYERIVIAGRGYISTEAIQLLSDHNANIILVDSFGRLIANINHVMSSHAGTKYRIGQYDTFRKPEKVLYLQKHLLTAKLQSQINFFTLLNNDKLHKAVLALLEYKNQTQLQNDKRGLLTIESRSGHIYFNHYAKLFPPRYNFDSRHWSYQTVMHQISLMHY